MENIKKEFSYIYIGELEKIKKFLKANKERELSISFVKVLPDGNMKPAREYYGKVIDISDEGFSFYTSWDMQKEELYPDFVKNIINLNSNFNFLPTLGITPIEKIFQNKIKGPI